jgi:hypothetical protein
LGTGFYQPRTWRVEEGLLTHGCIVNLLVQEHLDGLPELQGRGIEIAEGPDTFFFPLSLGRMGAHSVVL